MNWLFEDWILHSLLLLLSNSVIPAFLDNNFSVSCQVSMTVLFLQWTTSRKTVFPVLEKLVQNFHLIILWNEWHVPILGQMSKENLESRSVWNQSISSFFPLASLKDVFVLGYEVRRGWGDRGEARKE